MAKPIEKPNIFNEPKLLKKWAISLANACGGQEVSQTSIKLNQTNMQKMNILIDEFVLCYNNMFQAMQQEETSLNKEEEEE